ncbi:hypothetical protein DFH07DRAFT_840276 [Mycena maculata]|uniref:Uncharacterized protein n=1 Tax=Mycena maculata TaxID=230809 RepID=A0AAD7IBR1_9AGAR|nr:hypothetical protein DFH07DRAFT_840276 [Mycena maculata]
MRLAFLRCRPRCVLVVAALLLAALVIVTGAHPKLRHIARVSYNYYIADGGPWRTDGGPPTYTALRRWEAALPQHNLSLPFPEGKTGRYVKFSNQIRVLGWNNCFNEVLMNAHLAYVSGRAYVFQDYYWSHEHYQWPKEKWVSVDPRTPLNAIVSGPVAGGPFEPDDPAPRAISEAWFDVVCPLRERRYINTRDVKPAVAQAPGIEVLRHWQEVLSDAPERCIEIIGAEEDAFSQTFDLGLWGSPRLLTLWDSFSESPISRLLTASPIVNLAVERNSYLFLPRGQRPLYPARRDSFRRVLAMHLRRGDYEGHCRGMTYINIVFYSWNLFPHLPDRFISEPDAPGKDERFLARCWPDIPRIVQKAAASRDDYLAHAAGPDGMAGDALLDVIYILTNEKSAWINELKDALRTDGWATVATSQDLVLDAEQTDVSMAVDMEIARRAEVFVGNGWSSFTSNIVYERLVDKRDPITIRFT